MKGKRAITILSAVCISTSMLFVACGNDKMNSATAGNSKDDSSVGEDVKDVAEDAKDVVEDTTEGVKDAVEGTAGKLSEKIKDTTMEYDSNKFAEDLKSKGYVLKETDMNDNYFSVDGKKYSVNDSETLSVYEYGNDANQDIINDVDLINPDATTINGKAVTWNKSAHIYKKGRIVVIYDGDNADLLNALKDYLGDPILG